MAPKSTRKLCYHCTGGNAWPPVRCYTVRTGGHALPLVRIDPGQDELSGASWRRTQEYTTFEHV